MDIRHPMKDFDEMLISWCEKTGMPLHILLTKADKLSRGAAGAAVLKVRAALKANADLVSVQHFSALKHDGHKELIAVLDRWLMDTHPDEETA